MKKFLKRTITFFIILFLYFLGNIIFNKTIISHNQKQIENVNVLIVGSSNAAYSLNPELFHSAKNISQTAESFVMTYWKLKHILQKTKVDTLLIGLSHANVSEFNDYKFSDKKWSDKMFRRLYPIGNFLKQKNLKMDYANLLKIYFHNMCLFPKTSHGNYIGSFVDSNQNNLS